MVGFALIVLNVIHIRRRKEAKVNKYVQWFKQLSPKEQLIIAGVAVIAIYLARNIFLLLVAIGAIVGIIYFLWINQTWVMEPFQFFLNYVR